MRWEISSLFLTTLSTTQTIRIKTNKTILVLAIAAAFVAGTFVPGFAYADDDNGWGLGDKFWKLVKFLKNLKDKVQTNMMAIEGLDTRVTELEQTTDADSDPTNELQNLELTGTTLSITDGNSVELSSGGNSITATVLTLETCVDKGTSTGSTPVGWCPDSAKTKFIIQIDDSLVLPALIPVSLDASTDTGAICSVTDQGSELFGKFFVVQCTSAPHSSASLQYTIITS